MNDQNQTDDGKRGSRGIVASIHRLQDGKIRLVFDDVRQMPMLDASGWRHERLYTSAEFDQKTFEDLDLSKEELAKLAEDLILRLVALEKGGIPPVGYNVT